MYLLKIFDWVEKKLLYAADDAETFLNFCLWLLLVHKSAMKGEDSTVASTEHGGYVPVLLMVWLLQLLQLI